MSTNKQPVDKFKIWVYYSYSVFDTKHRLN